MAIQAGPIKLTGTFDDFCFYQMDGKYYVRRKSSLSSKRFQRDAAFARSRKSASRFGEGNRLASEVYQMVPKEVRTYPLFCFLKRKAILLFKEGKSTTEAMAALTSYLLEFGLLKEQLPATERDVIKKPSTTKKTTSCLKKAFDVAKQVSAFHTAGPWTESKAFHFSSPPLAGRRYTLRLRRSDCAPLHLREPTVPGARCCFSSFYG
jgi:hypothetical protein